MFAQFNEQGGLLIDLFEALVPNVTRGDCQETASEDFAYVGDEAEAIACHAASATSMSSDATCDWLGEFFLLLLCNNPHVLWRACHFNGNW